MNTDAKLIHQAAIECRNAMAALTEKVECGEITQADLQRELEQATIALDELARAIETAGTGDAPDVGVAPEMPAPAAAPIAHPSPRQSDTVFGGEQRPSSGILYR